MKRIYTILAAVLLTATVWAQSPEKMSYQAVIRDASDNLVTSQTVGMQISILQGSASGTLVYEETQTPTTNANGLVSIEIGGQTGFDTISWANGPYFIKTETDPTGGTSYTITGTSQLLSVPYALHAKTAEIVTGGITETDPIYSGSQAANIDATDITNLSNLSGTNTGDQDISGIVTNAQAIQDTASQIRADIPTNNNQLTNGAGYLTSFTEVDGSVTNEIELPTSGTAGDMAYWNGTAWVTVAATENEGATLQMIGGVPTWTGGTPPSVTNPTTGRIWMDRNLGALQVATSNTDTNAYGDLYQWGRAADGHESRTSSTTTSLSTSDTPGHGDFITNNSAPYDWRNPQNDNLWQGVSGTNNPCPSGYRLPTETEWNAERQSWSSNDAAGAFASPLKLTVAGGRRHSNGTFTDVGSMGFYWSSTVESTNSWLLRLFSNNADIDSNRRAYGFSVRCIKD